MILHKNSEKAILNAQFENEQLKRSELNSLLI